MDPAPALYTIRINGHLGATMLAAFPEMTARRQGAHTVLTGLLDRSALYGVLSELEALGLDLLEVRQLPPDGSSPQAHNSLWTLWPAGSAQRHVFPDQEISHATR
jgi:hypothetical protein